MKKRLICWLMVFLLVFSLFTVAQEDISEGSCSGFWGSISCFLWGNPENRAGAAWFDRGNVVGEAGEVYNQNLGVLEVDGLRYVRGRDPILYKEGIKSRMAFPLIYKGETIGSVNFGSRKVNNFSENQFAFTSFSIAI